MPTPRDIREKALLSLFAHTAHKGASLDDHTWELALEPEQATINKLALKALKHQLPALPQRAQEFHDLIQVIAPMMKTYELDKEARTALSLRKEVSALALSYSALGKLSKLDEIDAFYLKGLTLRPKLLAFTTSLDGSSFTAPELSKLQKVTKTLTDLTQRIDHIASPLEYPDQRSIAALSKACQEQVALRAEAQRYTDGVIKHIERIDEALSTHLHHYTQDQIGRVELNLLRLAAYELMILELPKGIVINENLELARKFSTEDAIPLLNGVLDNL